MTQLLLNLSLLFTLAACHRQPSPFVSSVDRRYHFGVPGQPPAGDEDGNEVPPEERVAGVHPMNLQPGE